nr:MAG TPA: hypothetical protein [Caudoviricetes sp.]
MILNKHFFIKVQRLLDFYTSSLTKFLYLLYKCSRRTYFSLHGSFSATREHNRRIYFIVVFPYFCILGISKYEKVVSI